MPWFITVPGALGALTAAGYAVLASWYHAMEPAVEQQCLEALAREKAARAAERVLERSR